MEWCVAYVEISDSELGFARGKLDTLVVKVKQRDMLARVMLGSLQMQAKSLQVC